jgi:hypothetical protein
MDPDSFQKALAAISKTVPGEENAPLPQDLSIEEQTRLVTEPNTMLPHFFELKKTVRGRRAGGTEIEERIDIQETVYTYPD